MPSIIIDHETHCGYTSAWRNQFPYGTIDYQKFDNVDALRDFAIQLYGGGTYHDDFLEFLFD